MQDKDISTIFNSPDAKEKAISLLKASIFKKSFGHAKDFGEYDLYKLLNYTSEGATPNEYTGMLIKLLLWVIEKNDQNDFLAHKDTEPDPMELLKSVVSFFRRLEDKNNDAYYYWVNYKKLEWASYETFTEKDLGELMDEFDVEAKEVLETPNH